MPEIQNVIAQTGPKKQWSTGKKIAVSLFIFSIIAAGIWGYLHYLHVQSMKKIASLIDTESKKYNNPDTAKKVITDAADSICENYYMRSEAKKLAADTNVAYEQAILDMAVAQLKEMGYITKQ